MNLLKEVDGNGWSKNRAILSTFPFNPRFFRRFVRSRLSRNDCSLPLVFVDEGVYNEQIGAAWQDQPIGDEYLLEPVSTPGVFHPKVNLYVSDRSVYYTVSSANISLSEYCDAIQIGASGGLQKNWFDDNQSESGNLQKAAVAKEVRDYYSQLASSDWVTGTDAIQYIDESAEELAWLDVVHEPDRRECWFLHNLQEPILDQVLSQVGSIERAILSAPYFGGLSILGDVTEQIDANRYDLIVEDGNTNLDAEGVVNETSRDLSIRKFHHYENRWIHAKFLLLYGEWGSAALFGSPNMTGAALLHAANDGNLEAAILRLNNSSDYFHLPMEDEPTSGGSTLASGFSYEISAPVSPETIEARTEAYEDWNRSYVRSAALRLKDARLSASEQEGDAELTLAISSNQLSGTREITIRPNTSIESISRTIELNDESIYVTEEVPENQRSEWVEAVVVVEDIDSGVVTNPRRVIPELQAYLTEYRELTESGGRQGAKELLDAFLFDDVGTAGIVLEEGIEFLLDIKQSGGDGDGSEQETDAETREWREQRFRALSAGTKRTPSPKQVIEKLLSHYLRQADAALDADPAGVEDVDIFVDYLNQYWHMVEFLQAAHGHALISEGVVEACEESLNQLYWHRFLRDYRTRLSDLISRILLETEDTQQEVSREQLAEQPEWKDVLRVLYSHPGFCMDIGVQFGSHLIPPHVVGAETYHVFTEMTPFVLTHLHEPKVLSAQRTELETTLQARLSDRIDDLEISRGSGYSVMLFSVLLREGEDHIRSLDSSPDVRDASAVGKLAIEGRNALTEYGFKSQKLLLATPQYSKLNQAIEELAGVDS